MDLFETLADMTKPDWDLDPFAAKNQEFVKAEKPENCKVKYHNFGVRKHGFCANCNGTDMKKN